MIGPDFVLFRRNRFRDSDFYGNLEIIGNFNYDFAMIYIYLIISVS